ncbi:MAG: ATP-binding cassette domain-containing protein [candidate division Zixibacteria bacterium]|nr:ATP-binding cassette domain-containing protein [candidate division Zixibacteria bacterium]
MKKLKDTTLQVIKRLQPYLKKHKKRAILAALASLVAVILQLPLPLLTMYLIDELVQSRDVQLLSMICGGLIVVLLLRMVASWWERNNLLAFRVRVVGDLKVDVYRRLINLPLDFIRRQQTGYLVSRAMGDVDAVQGLFADTLLTVLRNLLTFMAGLVMIFYLNVTLALIGLALLPLYAWTLFGFNKRLQTLTARSQEARAQSSRYVQEHLSGLAVIKSFVAEGRDIIGMFHILKNSLRSEFRANLWGNSVALLGGFVSALGPVLVLWIGITEIIDGRLTLGGLIAFNSFLGYLFGPLQAFSNVNITVQNAVASARRVFELLDQPVEDGFVEKGTAVQTPRFENGYVVFDNVSFAYPGKSNPALNNVSFNAPPGKITAIVGHSGAGKSTLVNLLFRFNEYSEGDILIDDRSIRDYNRNYLRSQIGLITQETFLFGMSVMDNIRLGKPHAGEDEIVAAAGKAYAHNFIENLPEGYYTRIGERGAMISGGEAQRIALARTILKSPSILVLDEAMSALDIEAENKVMNAIEESFGESAIIMISHRLLSVRDADQIICLDNGRVAGIDSHEQLYHNCPVYRNLYDEQYTEESKSKSGDTVGIKQEI